jgi:hypothetical protein
MPSTALVPVVDGDAIDVPCSIGMPSNPTCWVEAWPVEVVAGVEAAEVELEVVDFELELPQPASSNAQAAVAIR